jgi:nucleoid DNA-binding protein
LDKPHYKAYCKGSFPRERRIGFYADSPFYQDYDLSASLELSRIVYKDNVKKIRKKLQKQERDELLQVVFSEENAHSRNEVSAGGTVELRNFGVFKPVLCKSRPGRNPNKTEHEVTIPARMVVKFRAGKEFKERVKKLKPGNI